MDVKELKELDVAGLKKELNEQGEALFQAPPAEGHAAAS